MLTILSYTSLIVNQPEPRLFSTHLFGRHLLPQQLFYDTENKSDSDKNMHVQPEGKGRLIIVLRNLKDSLCSLHHFRGLPMDGWEGNEHGPGSYQRFIAEECPNAFGSTFEWVKDTNNVLKYICSERVHVVYYESFLLDFDAQLKQLNDFLGLNELTTTKCEAIHKACAAGRMSHDNARYTAVVEKGKIGEWEKYIDEGRWNEFDRIFDERLENVTIAEPMIFFQHSGFKSKLNESEMIEKLKNQWNSINN